MEGEDGLLKEEMDIMVYRQLYILHIVAEEEVMEEEETILQNLNTEEAEEYRIWIEITSMEQTVFVLYNIILKGLISMIHSHNLIIAPPPERNPNKVNSFEEGVIAPSSIQRKVL